MLFFFLLFTNLGGVCKRGTYCPPGSSMPIPCDPGYYCDQDGLSTVSNGCAAGYYCLGGSTEERPINKTYGDICPPGFFCDANSTTPLPCNKGFFSPDYGNKNISACTICKEFVNFLIPLYYYQNLIAKNIDNIGHKKIYI